jgi:hypothetical protein
MVNDRVKNILVELTSLDTCKNLTLVCNDEKFQLFHKGKQLGEDLTLADLRTLSRNALDLKIVQHVDVSNLIYERRITNTEGYTKVEDDIARAFLHVIHRMKFQKPDGVMATQKAEVAT